MKGRIVQDNIKKLEEGQVFVFGSNFRVSHGKCAAKQAMTWCAKYGQTSGIQGRTYGIPTKGKSMQHCLTPEEIRPYVEEFIEFARNNPQLTFLVTEIRCGLAGNKPKHIAPLFENAVNVSNIHLPEMFWHKLTKKNNMKKLITLSAIVLTLFFSSCTNQEDFEKGKKQLEQQGYTEIEDTGYDSWCCDENDTYSSGFKCKNSKGEVVEGCICSGAFKGVTIRFK